MLRSYGAAELLVHELIGLKVFLLIEDELLQIALRHPLESIPQPLFYYPYKPLSAFDIGRFH